jgi:hypothetical protein
MAPFPLLHLIEMHTEAVKAFATKIDLCLHPLLQLIQLRVVEPIDA